jgi:hypothetical protein
LFPTTCGTPMVQGETEADSNQPGSESRGIAQPGEPTVRAQQSLLRDVLCIGSVVQHSPGDAERQCAALLEALLKFAPEGSLLRIERQLGLCRATGPGEFLHPFSPYKMPDATARLGVRWEMEFYDERLVRRYLAISLDSAPNDEIECRP